MELRAYNRDRLLIQRLHGGATARDGMHCVPLNAMHLQRQVKVVSSRTDAIRIKY